jgi:hypothetical protein
MLDDVLRASSVDDAFQDDLTVASSDAEFIMLLNGLERLVLLSLANTYEENAAEEEALMAEKSPLENSGLLGYVSNVFTADSASHNVDQLTVCSANFFPLARSFLPGPVTRISCFAPGC